MEKTCSCCNKLLPITSFHKSKKCIYGVRSKCKICVNKFRRIKYKENPDKIKDQQRHYYYKNKEYRLSYQKEYRKNNRDKVKESYKKSRLKNIGLYLAKDRQREISKLNRTPKWLSSFDKLYIKYIYSFSKNISNYLGQKYHVDHIIPLQGELVSGLHVPSNLQVIPATINLQKGNKYGIRSY